MQNVETRETRIVAHCCHYGYSYKTSYTRPG